MNDQIIEKLRELVLLRDKIKLKKARDPLTHAATCRKLLEKLCGSGYETEINVLVAAVHAQIPTDILAWPPGAPIVGLLQGLSQQLAESHALQEAVARWAVYTWATALDMYVPPPALFETPPPAETREFFSTLRLEILFRRRDDPQSTWQKVAETPGSLVLPPEYDCGIRPLEVSYRNLRLWAQSFEKPEYISYLDLSGVAISDSNLEYLHDFTELRALSLAGTPINGEGFTHLESLPLTQVELQNCELLSDEGLKCIARLRRLQRLDLGGCTAITVKGLRALATLPRLKVLYLNGCTALEEEVLEVLAQFPELQELDLSQSVINGLGFVSFRNNQTLKVLELDNCPHLNDDGVAHLLYLKGLEILSLGNTAISDRALDYLATLPRLQRLHLHHCPNVSDAKIRQLRARRQVLVEPLQRQRVILGGS